MQIFQKKLWSPEGNSIYSKYWKKKEKINKTEIKNLPVKKTLSDKENHQITKEDSKRRKEQRNYKTARKELTKWE